MKKPKILAWCDFVAPTGFGNVAKNLLDDMHTDYEVSVVGINYFGNKRYDTNKYFVYSVTKDDMLGIQRLYDIAAREKPDIIFLFQDVFHISEIIKKVREVSPQSKIVTYFPIDGAPFSIAWENVLQESHYIITYSDWAIKVIKDRFPKRSDKIYKLYHGVDPTIFFPFTETEIINARKEQKWDNKFIVININRFQPRKAIPLSLRAFSMFAKGYHICKCGNHMPLQNNFCDLNGCPKSDFIETNDKAKTDIFIYLHMMNQEYSMGPGRTNLLQHFAINTGFADTDAGRILGFNSRNIYHEGIPESEINKIYNMGNVNISTAFGEGCGLSLLESAATGTPSIAPKNSAIPEQLNGTGILLSNESVYYHPMDNAHCRPHVNVWEMTKALEQKYQEWKSSGKEKTIDRACIENIHTNFQWEDKRELLKSIFQKALVK